jgi:hypothetical protein
MRYLPNRDIEVHGPFGGVSIKDTPIWSESTMINPITPEKKKRNSPSYKTELGKMREEKQKWLFRFCAATALAIAELIVIILIAQSKQ